MGEPDTDIQAVSDLVIVAGAMRRASIVVAGGDRIADLLLLEAAQDHGMVDRVILVGDERRIRDAIEQTHVTVAHADIVAAADDRAIAAATVAHAQAGNADIIIKGGIPTSVLYRELLKIQHRPTISIVTCFDAAPIADGRIMILTDPGLNIVRTYARMVDIIDNAAEVARLVLGLQRPRVAVISANEEETRALLSSQLAIALTRRRWDNADVYGPLSFDLAVDPQSAAIKRVVERFPASAPVAGRADILAFTGIDAANALYKSLMEMAGYGIAGLANINVGLQVPVAPVSRAELLSCRLASIALTSIYTQRRAAQTARARRTNREPMKVAPAPPPPRVLVVNPGSTTTKLAVFEGERELIAGEVRHAPASMERGLPVPALAAPPVGPHSAGDLRSRLDLVHQFLKDNEVRDIRAVVGRGGALPRGKRKLDSGVYEVARVDRGAVAVDQAIVAAVTHHAQLDHPCNLGIPLAAELARALRVPAFTADPVVVDEYLPEAELSGYAPRRRRNAAHVLSVKETARRAAAELGRAVEDISVVAVHLGGGVTVAALRRNQIVDSTISLLGDGPFSPQRAGRMALADVIELCYSGKFTRAQLEQELTTRGGLRSYLGTNDVEEIERRIADGDENARLALDAMLYWVAKEVGAFAAALRGEVDVITVTGGMARSRDVVDRLRDRVSHLAPVLVFPGSLEMQALAAAAIRALAGQEPIRKWADYAPSASSSFQGEVR
jgi:butyrate kinase